MSDFVFVPHPIPSVPVAGSRQRFPVHRIYCVGRNYAEHTREMGRDPSREPPFFFLKAADSVVGNGATVPYPARTANFHHEIELVVAIGGSGHQLDVEAARALVYGYAVGNDLTRRDLQLEARQSGRPWDTGKSVDASAAVGAIRPVTSFGHVEQGRIWLAVNGELRQQANIAEMIWKVPEIIAELSSYYALKPGDLIYTGTPAGVGPVSRGDRVEGGVDGLDTLVNVIG